MQGVAVQQNGVVFFAHGGGKLVHNAAVHTHKFIFRFLADFRQFRLRQAKAKQCVQRHGRGQLNGGRRGQARSQRHIAPKQHIRPAVKRQSAPLHGPKNTQRVIGPVLFGVMGQVIYVRLHQARFFKIQRIKAYFPVRAFGRRHIGVKRQRTGEYMTAVIIGMLPDKVYAGGCAEKARGLCRRKNFIKFLFQFRVFHRFSCPTVMVKFHSYLSFGAHTAARRILCATYKSSYTPVQGSSAIL